MTHLGFATMITHRKWWQFWRPKTTERQVEVTMERFLVDETTGTRISLTHMLETTEFCDHALKLYAKTWGPDE